jgi:hypothetical protein
LTHQGCEISTKVLRNVRWQHSGTYVGSHVQRQAGELGGTVKELV